MNIKNIRKLLLALIILLIVSAPADAVLAKYWRLRVVNSTDQTLTYDNAARVSCIMTPWKMTSGAMAYGTNITDNTAFLDSGGSIAAAAESEGTIQDNTSNLYIGIKGIFEVTADVTSTDGTVYLYLEESPDNSNWPSDQADFDCTGDLRLVATLTMSTDAEDEDRAVNFEF